MQGGCPVLGGGLDEPTVGVSRLTVRDGGDRACCPEFCACDAQASLVDEEYPDCGRTVEFT